jgi:hypothetical protein
MAKKAVQLRNEKPQIDKEKIKAVYKRDLISLEILKTKKALKNIEEAEEYYNDRVQHKFYIIDDLDSNYIIRISTSEAKKELRSVDPDHIPEIDQFELSESIQDILKENLFPVIKSQFPKKENNEN